MPTKSDMKGPPGLRLQSKKTFQDSRSKRPSFNNTTSSGIQVRKTKKKDRGVQTEVDSSQGFVSKSGSKITPTNSDKEFSDQIITSAKFQTDQQNQCLVGLNLFDEVSDKYYQQLKAKLKQSILIKKPSICFDDIAGNDFAKEVITQTFIIPETHP